VTQGDRSNSDGADLDNWIAFAYLAAVRFTDGPAPGAFAVHMAAGIAQQYSTFCRLTTENVILYQRFVQSTVRRRTEREWVIV
jgi:hypothetical protein